MKIKVFIESGANIHSCNKDTVTPQQLGFDSDEEWLNADEDEKFKAVQDFWNGQGYPEIYWEED